jgi:hypothetical protein
MRSAGAAVGAYTAIAVVATWPLALGLGRDVPWDLGDSLMVMWALAWDCEQLLGLLGGDTGRLASFFDANIFYPEPLTLAYSEHFVGQAIQVLPVYTITRNPILCYNLLFLSTFALSGLGAYLFVHDLTRSRPAAFLAGLAFAFSPCRFPQASHLHVLSAQWMPFALYGLRRYIATERVLPLAGAGLALVAQNLSCMYYMLYFSPFAAAYTLWEIVQRGAWPQRRLWLHLSTAVVLVGAVTTPFLLPYAELRERFPLARDRQEVVRFSADVYSYAAAYPLQLLWGSRLDAYEKPEGHLFPGFTAVGLALLGLLAWRQPDSASGSADRGAAHGHPAGGRATRALATVLALAAAAHIVAAAVVLVERRVVADFGLFSLRMTDVNQLLLRALAAAGAWLALSPPARMRAGAFIRARGFFLAGLVAALWLSLGPEPQVMGRPLQLASPYALLYEYVPGFDSVRAPARLAMVAMLMLSVFAGFGATLLARRPWTPGAVALLAGALLAEAIVWPFVINGVTPPPGYAAPPGRVFSPSQAPPVYQRLLQEPADAVVVELPIGQPDYDLRAVYYSTVHWRSIVNGYSGFFPPHYPQLALALDRVPRQGDVAWGALRAAGATLVLVHEDAFPGSEGPETSAELARRGAVEIFRDGGDVLLRLPQG